MCREGWFFLYNTFIYFIEQYRTIRKRIGAKNHEMSCILAESLVVDRPLLRYWVRLVGTSTVIFIGSFVRGRIPRCCNVTRPTADTPQIQWRHRSMQLRQLQHSGDVANTEQWKENQITVTIDQYLGLPIFRPQCDIAYSHLQAKFGPWTIKTNQITIDKLLDTNVNCF